MISKLVARSYKGGLRTVAVLIALLSLLVPGVAGAANPSQETDVSNLAITEEIGGVSVDSQLEGLKGTVEVVVRLKAPSLTQALGRDIKRAANKPTLVENQGHLQRISQEQDALMAQISSMGGREITRFSRALNAVVVSIDASRIRDVAKMAGVSAVRQVTHYELELTETVPYIGAGVVQATGVDGSGVVVAVLDSGVDYTHKNLGGPGTLAAYAAAYGTSTSDPLNTTRDGLFPTAKVVDGFDFVGEVWPTGPGGNTNADRTEDPDPIDLEGHGTHVADIIAGKSLDGTHKGVAPGASIVAVKVCSAVASSCNGVALLKGVEFSLDPNGDGDLSDAVDVINMSLGSSYGRPEDDLSFASANAVKAGVVVVASAGNSADRPYIVGSPSSTAEVISVAQTQVPSAVSFALRITAPAVIAGLSRNTATVSYAPISSAGFAGDVVFAGLACDGNPLPPGLTGKVVLVDRGACAVSQKVRNVSAAGASAVLLGLVAAGDAVTFSNGGECPTTPDGTCKPTLVIIQPTSTAIKARLNAGDTVSVAVSTADSTALIGSMVGSSSRGPNAANAIKPDIGAPGASISAIAGTGDGTEPFGGTSGAAPMVAGAAALLLDKYPNRTPAEIKAVLMNTADTDIETNPANAPGVLAPISRIGGGEVRVNRAVSSTTAAWDARDRTGSLSFGYLTVWEPKWFAKRLLIRNYSNVAKTYYIQSNFRYADDAANGGVFLGFPETVRVPANSSRTIPVEVGIIPNLLPQWTLNGGSLGGTGSTLQSVEFDGYLTITNDNDATDIVTVPWQVMPRRSANVYVNIPRFRIGWFDTIVLGNWGASVTTQGEIFALTGQSSRVPRTSLPKPGDNFAIVDLRAVGVRPAVSGTTPLVQFGINTFGTRPHPNYPAQFSVFIDNNNDGDFEFEIFNAELGTFASSGQNVVFIDNLDDAAPGTARFFTDADLNSANVILTAPLADLGLTPTSQFTFAVAAFDNYFTGNLTDVIENMRVTPGTLRYVPVNGYTLTIPANEIAPLTIGTPAGGSTASPSQRGFLILVRNQMTEREGIIVRIDP